MRAVNGSHPFELAVETVEGLQGRTVRRGKQNGLGIPCGKQSGSVGGKALYGEVRRDRVAIGVRPRFVYADTVIAAVGGV